MKRAIPLLIGFGGVIAVSSCTMPEPPATSSENRWTTEIGASCSRNADCAIGLNCNRSAPGGSCFKPCKTGSECGGGAVCSNEKCVPACQRNADCRAGFACSGTLPMACHIVREPEAVF